MEVYIGTKRVSKLQNDNSNNMEMQSVISTTMVSTTTEDV